MNPDQALDVLRAVINAPVVKLALSANELCATAQAVEALAAAVAPKPEPGESPKP